VLGLLFALLGVGAAGAAAPVNSKALYWRFLSGQGTAVTFQQQTATANTKILDLKDDSAATVFSVDREGDIAGTTFSGVTIRAADSTQTLAGSGALTLTSAKSLFPVAGMSGAVTGCTVPDGATAGTLITIVGTHATNTVQFAVNGATNIAAANGVTTRTLATSDLLNLIWTGTAWAEIAFNNNL
jgi:hypothetical protein